MLTTRGWGVLALALCALAFAVGMVTATWNVCVMTPPDHPAASYFATCPADAGP